jgi:hypothetical protein
VIVKLILSTLVYPALSAALIWFLALWLGRGKTRAWPNAAALASAYMAAYLGLEGIPQFPPPASLAWLFFWIPVFALLGWLLSLRAWPVYVRMVLCALVSPPALYFTLRSTVQYEWQPGVTILWLTGLTGVLLLSQATLNRASRTMDRPPAEWLFLGSQLCSIGALSLALGASGSVKLAQLGGALGVVVFLHAVFRFKRCGEALYQGGTLPLSLTYLGLVLNGLFYSELPRSSAGLLMLCLLSPGLLLLPPLRNRTLSLRLAVLITICLVCGGLAVGLAATAGSSPADYYDY